MTVQPDSSTKHHGVKAWPKRSMRLRLIVICLHVDTIMVDVLGLISDKVNFGNIEKVNTMDVWNILQHMVLNTFIDANI